MWRSAAEAGDERDGDDEAEEDEDDEQEAALRRSFVRLLRQVAGWRCLLGGRDGPRGLHAGRRREGFGRDGPRRLRAAVR